MSSNGLGGLTGKPPPREDPGHSSAATLAKRVPPKATESKSRAVHPKSKPGKESSKSNAKSTKVATVVPPTNAVAPTGPAPPLHPTIPLILGGYSETPVPYYEQDDPAHETPDARRKRAKLATDTSVTKAIETFIDAAFAAAGAKGDRVASFPREMYTAVMSAVARALIPSISYADAQRAVDDDWARDAGSGSAEAIDRARLHKAVFELVDLWTLGISAEEYVAFARVITAAAVVALSRVSLGVVVENEAGKPMIELARVNPGSAAAHAGMVPGGFITAINLTPTPSNSVFTTTIKTYSPGEFVTIKEHRGSLDAPETEIRVQLGAAGMTMAAFLQHWSILQHNKPRPGGRG